MMIIIVIIIIIAYNYYVFYLLGTVMRTEKCIRISKFNPYRSP